MFIAGILVSVVGIVFTALMLADHLPDVFIFFSMTNILIYIITSAGVTLSTGSLNLYIKTVNAIVSKKYYISAADKERGIRYLKLMGKTVTYTGVLIFFMSIVLLLLVLSELSQIEPYIAVALISLFYMALINMVFVLPGIHILENRYNMEEKRVISEKQVIDKLMELCYKQGVTPEQIIDANEIKFE